MNPVDADTERHVAPVGRVSSEAHRQRDGERDEKDEGAKRAAGLEPQQQGDDDRHQPRRKDLAQVGLRHDPRDGGDARGERRAAHRLGSHEQLGAGRQQEHDQAPHDPAAETGPRGVEIGGGRAREQQLEREAADRRGEAQQDESADERGDHLTRKD